MNYSEHIYNSPIKTSAGETHFSGGDFPNYFAHTRIEDLPLDTKAITSKRTAKIIQDELGNKKYQLFENGKLVKTTGRSGEAQGWELANTQDISRSGTRRVIEIQSDLFQKGRLEQEIGAYPNLDERAVEKTRQETAERVASGRMTQSEADKFIRIEQEQANRTAAGKKRIEPLEPYRNTWQDRIIREEVKQAAIDGKTKLQFPTGETAMKIEGLETRGERFGTVNPKTGGADYIRNGEPVLKPENLKAGMELAQPTGATSFDRIIVTEVLGDGKFKWMTKENFDYYQTNYDVLGELKKGNPLPEKIKNALSRESEGADISGKVDKENPIYKFYEKEVARFLTNKFGAKRIKDAQGVEWFEVPITKEMANEPVLAYGRSSVKTLIGGAGVVGVGIPILGNFLRKNKDADSSK